MLALILIIFVPLFPSLLVPCLNHIIMSHCESHIQKLKTAFKKNKNPLFAEIRKLFGQMEEDGQIKLEEFPFQCSLFSLL